MLPLSLASINEARLQELCESECPESQTLDFKRELPGKQDQDKHELCKDVVALANAEGGDLVYGIEEKNGVAGSIARISTEDADAAERRMRQVLDAGIEPKIHGLRIQKIPVSDGYVLILRVPASYDGPHCIRTDKNNKQQRRFVMRNGTMISDMSYDQIRGAFDRTATLAEQTRRFIATRRELIANGETPVPLKDGPQLVVHLVPIAGLAGRMTVDLRQIKESAAYDFNRIDSWDRSSCSFNFDGLFVYPGEQTKVGYTHVFRTGILEGVELGGALQEVSSDSKRIPSFIMSRFFYVTAQQFIGKAKNWGFSGPAVLSISLLNVMGYKIGINPIEIFNLNIYLKEADRPHLVPSEVWIEDIDNVDIDSIIRPLLDTLWQAFGVERCLDFDDATGKFNLRR
jgi:hypothetical protein